MEKSTSEVCHSSLSVHTFTMQSEDILKQFAESICALEALDKPVYVDIQCLKSTKGDIIKEFSAKCEDGPTAWIMVISPDEAQPVLKRNNHLRDQVHGIDWGTGHICIEKLRSITRTLFENNRRVFVKGRQKVAVLTKQLSIPLDNITTLNDCSQLIELRKVFCAPSCVYHREMDDTLACSMKNVGALVSLFMPW